MCMCPLLTWGTVYIQSGSEISDCNMKCPQNEGVLELYRRCGGKVDPLLDLHCDNLYTKNNYKTRLHLHTGSGCWKLTQTGRRDSCVYITEYNSHSTDTLSSTEIRVLDPVLISNISSNCSRLGEEMAVSVQFSGEESAVTWEVDGKPLPERYRLIDDNRTLIIPSVQRDDTERRFRVRITNPVSEEIREYRLTNDMMFIRMLETEDVKSSGMPTGLTVGLIVGGILAVVIFRIYQICSRRRERRNLSPETTQLNGIENGAAPSMENGAVPAMENGAVPAMENGAVPAMGNGAVPAMENGAVPTVEHEDVPAMGNRAVPTIENGAVPAIENEALLK